jgi:hypothetical protein
MGKARITGKDAARVEVTHSFESMRSDEIEPALIKILADHGVSVADPPMIDVTPHCGGLVNRISGLPIDFPGFLDGICGRENRERGFLTLDLAAVNIPEFNGWRSARTGSTWRESCARSQLFLDGVGWGCDATLR